MLIEQTEFKGHKILTFKEGKRILLAIGIKKARLILEHIEAIKAFLAKNSASNDTGRENPLLEPQGNEIISNSI